MAPSVSWLYRHLQFQDGDFILVYVPPSPWFVLKFMPPRLVSKNQNSCVYTFLYGIKPLCNAPTFFDYLTECRALIYITLCIILNNSFSGCDGDTYVQAKSKLMTQELVSLTRASMVPPPL